MIKNSPILILNRLIIRSYNNTIVYDESFHQGVNIIRGKNSSGKSTISNFIFYVLGGAYNNWTSESQKCKDVTAEIQINNSIYTLRREISGSVFTKLEIYWGNYEQSKIDNQNWKTFPYKQTEDILSFSNVLFNAFEFPEVKGDLDSNITMHQILRLLYIDQETSPLNLFRQENFDPPLTRKTISEILLGIYDNSLYSDRINLRDRLRDLELKEREFKSLINIIDHSGYSSDRIKIEGQLVDTKTELKRTNQEIQDLKDGRIIRITGRTKTQLEEIKSNLSEQKLKVSQTISKINQYQLDIADSQQFIETLNKRIEDLYNSIHTRDAVGSLSLTHCPQCLSELDKDVPEHHCKLCKQVISEDADKANARRLLQEMQLQVKESTKLLTLKENTCKGLIGLLPNQKERLRFLQKELDSSIEHPQTTRNEKIDDLLISKGFIESKIESLTNQLKMVEVVENLKDEIKNLSAVVKDLKLNIDQKEKEQNYRRDLVTTKIKEITVEILRKDLPRQDEFRTGKTVKIDFSKDVFSLDGNNNFSASSKTYFKNAILFSIFFCSLEFDFMRYPRFILCDNMEDKGMEKERTQNFQEIITEFSEKYIELGKEHQIIFTTSMISDKLDNTDKCVGGYYDTENKTLVF